MTLNHIMLVTELGKRLYNLTKPTVGWFLWHINPRRMFNDKSFLYINILNIIGGARGVMVIVEGYEHGDTSSNPRPD